MSRIKVTLLGTTAGVPTEKRAHACIHVSYDDGEEFSYLFDCGENAQRQLMKAHLNIMKINDVFISHWHGDHCLGLAGMVDTMGFEGRKIPLTIYAPEARRIKRCLSFSHSMGRFRVVPRRVPATGRHVKKLLDMDRFTIVSVPVKHSVPAVAYALVEKDKRCIDLRKAIPLGLPEKSDLYAELKKKGRIRLDKRHITLNDISTVKKGKKIVYSGDTEICGNLKRLVRDADLVIQDCTYFERQGADRPYKHAALPEIIDMVSEENVKKVILTHISRKYTDTKELKTLIGDRPNFEIAEDFMETVI